MRQVPYCIIGNGRLAQHLLHWSVMLRCPVVHWQRSQSHAELLSMLHKASTIILAINDDSLPQMASELKDLIDADQILVHCSGAQTIIGAWGCHPMMTFGQHLYELSHYQAIRWVVDGGAPKDLLQHFIKHRLLISPEQKSLYHAWCVLAGNGTSLLWQQCLNLWQQTFGWDQEDAVLFAESCLRTGLSGDPNRLSGPMIRGDQTTITQHLQVLEGAGEKTCYQGLCQIAEDLL